MGEDRSQLDEVSLTALLEAREAEVAGLLPGRNLNRRPSPELRAALESYAGLVVRHASGAAVELGAPDDWAAALARRPVFIVGTHRSGTTLMQRLLDDHPELLVLPSEGSYLTNIYAGIRRLPPARRLREAIRIWIPRFINAGNQPPYWLLGRTGGPEAPYLQLARAALRLGRNEGQLFRLHAPFEPYLAVVMAFGASRGIPDRRESVRYWVEKTPTNEIHAEELIRAFPGARFIHLVRDPRAISASIRRLKTEVLGERPGLGREVLRIGRSFSRALSNQTRYGDVYRVVRYEDLVQDPSAVMDSIRRFLGIGAHSGLCRPTLVGLPCAGNSSYDRPLQPRGCIETDSLTAYLEELTWLERQLVGSLIGSKAAALGYRVERLGLRTVTRSVSEMLHRDVDT